MKDIISIILIIGGVALGVYVGLWVCFVGGIVDLVVLIQSPETITRLEVGWGIVRIVFASTIGVLVGSIPIAIGKALID